MDSVTPEDAIKIAAIRRKTHVCVLDAQQQMRTARTSPNCPQCLFRSCPTSS